MPQANVDPQAKFARLAQGLAELGAEGGVLVAFSGGVDSGVLLHAARAVLGERASALIADSASLARRELGEARAFAAALGAPLVEIATAELADPRYRANSGDRCYWCKTALFAAMTAWAAEHGARWLTFGAITDDLADVRPGARAAAEFGVRAPLLEAGLSKADVRAYARAHGLALADKPQSACLASRLPVGRAVTRERLARIEAAEDALRELGFRQLRVRDLGAGARVEVGAGELERAQRAQPAIEAALARLGFALLELAAYRSPGAG